MAFKITLFVVDACLLCPGLSWVIMVQELLAGSLGCSRAHGSGVCWETEFLLLCESKNNSAMGRGHLGLCPLRNSPLKTCGGVPASTIPQAGQVEALGVPGRGFLGSCFPLAHHY